MVCIRGGGMAVSEEVAVGVLRSFLKRGHGRALRRGDSRDAGQERSEPGSFAASLLVTTRRHLRNNLRVQCTGY